MSAPFLDLGLGCNAVVGKTPGAPEHKAKD
jgi:hypothetical protein